MRRIAFLGGLFVVMSFFAGCESVKEIVIDEPIVVAENEYYNERFDFKVDKIEGFELESMPSGEGVMFRKWDQFENEEVIEDYQVVISAFGVENFLEYEGVGDLVISRYQDYDKEFVKLGDSEGVFVNEGLGKRAVRHFFVFDEDLDVIYELRIEIPSPHFPKYQEQFNQFVETLELV